MSVGDKALTAPPPPRAVSRYTRQARPCPYGGKNSYRTKRKAQRIAEGLRQRDSIKLYVYRCKHCSLWHLSKQAPNEAAA